MQRDTDRAKGHCAQALASTSIGDSSVIFSSPDLTRGSSIYSVSVPVQLTMNSESTARFSSVQQTQQHDVCEMQMSMRYCMIVR